MRSLTCAIVSLLSLGSAGCSVDYTEELPGGYYLASESNDQNVVVSHGRREGDPYIPCNVIAVESNLEFSVIKQVAADYDCFWADSETLDSQIGKEFFWIIDGRSSPGVLIGPLDSGELEKIAADLGVPESLRIHAI